MPDDRLKLHGQREAVQEHIAKAEYYKGPGEREFAFKTVRNAQAQIAVILKRHPHWPASWEDKWLPGMNHPKLDWKPDD